MTGGRRSRSQSYDDGPEGVAAYSSCPSFYPRKSLWPAERVIVPAIRPVFVAKALTGFARPKVGEDPSVAARPSVTWPCGRSSAPSDRRLDFVYPQRCLRALPECNRISSRLLHGESHPGR
jgi:hypothetical protein